MDTDNLGETECELINASFATSTYAKYARMWARFINYILDFDLDFSENSISKYVAYLYESGLKYNSMQVHLTAIARGLEARKLPDTTKTPRIQRMILGAKRLTFTKDIRQPFTEYQIKIIVRTLPFLCSSRYEYKLFCAVVTWAFAGGLRVSEYTESDIVDHNLHRSCIDAIAIDGNLAYRVTFRSYKSCPDTFPDFVLVTHPDPEICPVWNMHTYLRFRPGGDGPLFQMNGSPLKRKGVADMLQRVCRFHEWDKCVYTSHSFRIGRATLWAKQGYSDTQIQHMGRWRSDAFKKYIRPDHVVLK